MKNSVVITGTVISSTELYFRHKGRGYYRFFISNPRNSGECDIIPVVATEQIIEPNDDYTGRLVKIYGYIESRIINEDSKGRLNVYVYTEDISFYRDADAFEAINSVIVEGEIYKEPVLRKTTTGKRATDVFVKVERGFNWINRIPCICWFDNAEKIAQFTCGDYCSLKGRLQSREYEKPLEDGTMERRRVTEVAVNHINWVRSTKRGGQKYAI